MICLGIESTAHTFGCGILSSRNKILADVRDMYKTQEGGINPSKCAQHHKEIYLDVIKKAISESKNSKIDLVAYSRGPGLSPSLNVGLRAAQEISKELAVPLIGVNHIIAHLTSSKLFNNVNDPVYLFTSGANTQIIALEGGKFRIFGETLDIGVGNALDKFGRIIGLGFPAGAKIEELARKGKYVELPYSVKGMDVAFSGIVTKTQELSKKNSKEDLCYSMQETCFAMLTEVCERALAHCDKKEVVLIGGVAANKRFCEMLNIMCNERNAKFYSVPLKYAGDNAVMIAYEGLVEYLNGVRDDKYDIRPYERVDDIKVFW
jgi:N6-L-threonylcarbamoyladenine synthase